MKRYRISRFILFFLGAKLRCSCNSAVRNFLFPLCHMQAWNQCVREWATCIVATAGGTTNTPFNALGYGSYDNTVVLYEDLFTASKMNFATPASMNLDMMFGVLAHDEYRTH